MMMTDNDDDDDDDENKPDQQQTAGQGLICCTSRHRQKLGNNLCDKYEDEDTEDYDHDLVFYIFIIFKLGNTFHIKYDDEDDDEIDEYDESDFHSVCNSVCIGYYDNGDVADIIK